MPLVDWVCLTPGISCAIFSSRFMTAALALGRGRVGELNVDQEVAHVLRRDETRGVCLRPQ